MCVCVCVCMTHTWKGNKTDCINFSHLTVLCFVVISSCFGAGAIYLIFLIVSGTFLGINVWRKVKAN